VVFYPRKVTHKVMAVIISRGTTSPKGRRPLAIRLAAVAVLCLVLGTLASPVPAMKAAATAATSSAVTISWAGDASAAREFQPARLVSSPHYNELKNITITVSQTTGIADQAIRIDVSGFAGTKSVNGGGVVAQNAMNFMQAMQCWGPDPKATDFNETCQWGGRALSASNGLGDSVILDNASRTGPLDFDPGKPTTHDVPFRPVGSDRPVSGKPYFVKGETKYDISNYFGASTTNEVTSARVGDKGTGYFGFETQSADQAPQLGCGTAAHLRCWLVVVPRGTVFGGDGEQCSGILDPKNNYEPYTKGRPNSIQGGSPVNDKCDYFNNRIVVPLDFTPTGSTCAVGSTEVRVIGSQLMVGAMSSWQPSLCTTVKSTFSFSTNPDSVARAQLIETSANTPNIAYSGFPVSAGELLFDSERQTLATTKLAYAPVAISGVVIAFLAEFDNGRQEQLNISPRLMAKLLTQSYPFLVPASSSDPVGKWAHLSAVNRKYTYISLDPDFQALNPTNYREFNIPPALVLPGPAGADAIRQVWRWILADKDAVAFLDGNADPSGMLVNPYYLAKGATGAIVPWYLDDKKDYIGDGAPAIQRAVGLTNLDGSPQKLSEISIDNFPRDDETLVPANLKAPGAPLSRFDSIQFSPFTDSLLTGARQAFRANPNSKSIWDPNKLNSLGTSGDWVSSGTQVPGQKFMIAITDSPSAARYGLNTAGIQIPNSTSVATADMDGMAAALSALQPTSVDTVMQVDPAKVSSKGYPMTMVTYAGVNLSKASSAARAIIASMLTQVTSSGQISGSAVGDLPAGYLPLTGELQARAADASARIKNYVAPATDVATTSNTGTDSNGTAQDSYDGAAAVPTAAAGSRASNGAADPTVTAGVDAVNASRTESTPGDAISRFALVFALVIGLLGFLIAPVLFRGRRLL
jgi:hypothetical protein